MQHESSSGTGLTSSGGGTSPTLLPTPAAMDSRETRNRTAARKPGSKHHDGVTMRDAVDLGLISSVVASPASLFRWLEVAKGMLMSAGSGTPIAKLCKSSGRHSFWLKMYQGYAVQKTLWGGQEDSCEEYSETLPTCGTMRNGVLYRQPPLISRISDTASSLLPTAKATDGTKGGPNQRGSKGDMTLPSAVQLPPTPNTGISGGERSADRKGTGDLKFMARHGLLPTPQVRDHFPPHSEEYIAKKKAQGHGMSNLNDTAGGLLNPQFVEALMGFPIGWTDLDASETPSSRKSLSGSAGE